MGDVVKAIASPVGALLGPGAALTKAVWDAGSEGQKSSSQYTSESGVRLREASDFEKQLAQADQDQYNKMNSLVESGPGGQDVARGTQSARGLADMLAEYAKTGGLPGEADYAAGRSIAANQFDPQRTALNQQFEQDTISANREAARLGRSVNDPILRNKLLQQKNNQFAMLESQQNAAATGFALNQPMQRLSYQSQLADVTGNLASQALNNRQTLLSLGNTLKQQERQFRLSTGVQWTSGEQKNQSGGGVLGGLGAIAGVTGSLISIGGGLKGLGGGGGMGGMGGGMPGVGQQAAPAAAPMMGPMPSAAPMAQPYQPAPISPFIQNNSSYRGPGYDNSRFLPGNQNFFWNR